VPSRTIGAQVTIRSKRITSIAMNNKNCPIDSGAFLTADYRSKPHVQGQHEFGSSGAVQVTVKLGGDGPSIVEEIAAGQA
jgi:hypothetical protein